MVPQQHFQGNTIWKRLRGNKESQSLNNTRNALIKRALVDPVPVNKNSSDRKAEVELVTARVSKTKKEIEELKLQLQKLISDGIKSNTEKQEDLLENKTGSSTNNDHETVETNSTKTKTFKHVAEIISNGPGTSKEVSPIKEHAQATRSSRQSKSPEKATVEDVPKKVRHYDKEAARQYIKKQRERRKELMKNKVQENVFTQDIKKQRLQELYQKSMQLVSQNVKNKRERSRSREPLNQAVENETIAQESRKNNDNVNVNKVLNETKSIPSHRTLTKALAHPHLANVTIRSPEIVEDAIKTDLVDSIKQKAAIVIQKAYRNYRRRKLVKVALNKPETPIGKVVTSKEVQTNQEKVPAWLQTPTTLPYPYNFISAVKRKLNMVVQQIPANGGTPNTPKICDAAVQSSFNEKPDQSDNRSLSLEKSAKNNKSVLNQKNTDLKSFLSHKCLDLDLKNVEPLMLTRKSNLTDNVVKNGCASDSDTSKNIPEISSESSLVPATSNCNVHSGKRAHSSDTDEQNLRFDTDRVKKLKLRQPNQTSLNHASPDISEHIKSGKLDEVDLLNANGSSGNFNSLSRRDSVIAFNICDYPKEKSNSHTSKAVDSNIARSRDSLSNKTELKSKNIDQTLSSFRNYMKNFNDEDSLAIRTNVMEIPEKLPLNKSNTKSENTSSSGHSQENSSTKITERISRSSGTSHSSSILSDDSSTLKTTTPCLSKKSDQADENILLKKPDINLRILSSRTEFQQTVPEAHESSFGESHKSSFRESHKSLLRESHKPALKESHQSALRESHQSALRESHQSALRESHLSALRESHQSALKESHQSALKESHQSELRQSHKPALRESHQSALRESHKPSFEESRNQSTQEYQRSSSKESYISPPNESHQSFSNKSSQESIKTLSPEYSSSFASVTSTIPTSAPALKPPNISLRSSRIVNPPVSTKLAKIEQNQINNIVLRPGEKVLTESKLKSNEIHLKFEAELHLLNEFNDSLRQVMAVEKSLLELHKNTSKPSLAKTTTLRTRDTQTSILTQTSSSSRQADESKRVDNQVPSINYSRGSEISEQIESSNFNETIGDMNNSSLITTGLKLSQSKDNVLTSSVEESNVDVSVSVNEKKLNGNPYAGLSLEMFDQCIKDEDVRIENLKMILKIREKALVDRTKGELAWLEIQKKHLKDSGQLKEISAIKKKQRGLLIKLEHERHEMQRLKQMQKAASKERKSALKEQRNMIKAQLSTAGKMITKIKRNNIKEDRRHSGPLKVYNIRSRSESIRSETSLSRKSSGTEEVISVVSHSQSIVSHVTDDALVSEDDGLDPKNEDMIALPNSARVRTDSVKRSLLMREAVLQKRRKAAEELLQWHQRLLEEEKEITELETAASAIINQAPTAPNSITSENRTNYETCEFEGSQLNLLWRNITGADAKKFDDHLTYSMSKVSFERFCKDAKRCVLKSGKSDASDSDLMTKSDSSLNSSIKTALSQSSNKNSSNASNDKDYTSDFESVISQVHTQESTTHNKSSKADQKNEAASDVVKSLGSSDVTEIIDEISSKLDNSSSSETIKIIEIPEISSRTSDKNSSIKRDNTISGIKEVLKSDEIYKVLSNSSQDLTKSKTNKSNDFITSSEHEDEIQTNTTGSNTNLDIDEQEEIESKSSIQFELESNQQAEVPTNSFTDKTHGGRETSIDPVIISDIKTTPESEATKPSPHESKEDNQSTIKTTETLDQEKISIDVDDEETDGRSYVFDEDDVKTNQSDSKSELIPPIKSLELSLSISENRISSDEDKNQINSEDEHQTSSQLSQARISSEDDRNLLSQERNDDHNAQQGEDRINLEADTNEIGLELDRIKSGEYESSSNEIEEQVSLEETDNRTSSEQERDQVKLEVSEDRNSSETDKDTISSEDNRDGISLENTEDRISSEKSKDVISSENDEDRISSENNENSLSSENNKDRISSEGDKDRISSEGDKDRISSEDDKDRISSEDDKDRVSSEDFKDRISSEDNKDGISSEDNKDRINSEIDEDRINLESNGDRISTETNEDRISSETNEYRISSETDEDRVSSESNEDSISSANNEDRIISENNEDDISSENKKNRISSEKNKDRISSENIEDRISSETDKAVNSEADENQTSSEKLETTRISENQSHDSTESENQENSRLNIKNLKNSNDETTSSIIESNKIKSNDKSIANKTNKKTVEVESIETNGASSDNDKDDGTLSDNSSEPKSPILSLSYGFIEKKTHAKEATQSTPEDTNALSSKNNSAIEFNDSDNEKTDDSVSDIKSEKSDSSKRELNKKRTSTAHTEHVDVKKRVSEILADANLASPRGDKSPRLQDIYTTAYDIFSPERSPESGSPTETQKTFSPPNHLYANDEVEELLKKQLAIEQEIKEIEQQQQKEQLPYLYLREIPNKPPPPYTPPVPVPATVAGGILPINELQIGTITPAVATILYNAYINNNLPNVTLSEEDKQILHSKSNIDEDCFEFIFDLCKEVAVEHYKQFEPETGPSWMHLTKKTKLALGQPLDKTRLESLITKKVRQLLGYETVKAVENIKCKWSSKKRDHVDDLLVVECQAEEAEWINYDRDELIVKNELAEDIINMLLSETAQMFNNILAKKTYLC